MLPTTEAAAKKILIVRTSALGDVVHTLPALDALKSLFPGARVNWIVEPLAARLLEGHPSIDRIIVLPRQHWKRQARNPLKWPAILGEIWRLSRSLRKERFDLTIDFHCNLRSAVILLLAGGRQKVGFHPADISESGGALFTTLRAPRARPRLNKVEKNLLLVRALGFEGPCPRGTLRIEESEREWARTLFASLPGSGPSIVVHPAVSKFGEIKRWPTEHYRELLDLLRSRHDARTLITWGPGEREVAARVGRRTLLGEEVSLPRFAAILAQADLVIAGDTGALPIASLLGTPTVGLYGPKDAAVYSPYPFPGETLSSTAPCSPCKLRECEHRICMSLIRPEAVLAAAERALELARVSPS